MVDELSQSPIKTRLGEHISPANHHKGNMRYTFGTS